MIRSLASSSSPFSPCRPETTQADTSALSRSRRAHAVSTVRWQTVRGLQRYIYRFCQPRHTVRRRRKILDLSNRNGFRLWLVLFAAPRTPSAFVLCHRSTSYVEILAYFRANPVCRPSHVTSHAPSHVAPLRNACGWLAQEQFELFDHWVTKTTTTDWAFHYFITWPRYKKKQTTPSAPWLQSAWVTGAIPTTPCGRAGL